MPKFKCDKCPKSFEKQHGLNVHIHRIHSAAGKTWGQGKSKASLTASPVRRSKNESMREKIRSILDSHPDGLQVKNIIAKLKSNGYRPSGDVSGYISQTCSSDSEITRIERGVYRLKNIPTPVEAVDCPATQESATIEQPELTIQSLLVRIGHLEKERDALRNAHLTFVREVGA